MSGATGGLGFLLAFQPLKRHAGNAPGNGQFSGAQWLVSRCGAAEPTLARRRFHRRGDAASKPMKNDSNPLHHTQRMAARLRETIDHLRADIGKVEEPQFKAMFETS